jgi:ABC-type Fe3+-hydroxamate transport system substrate-binding protein
MYARSIKKMLARTFPKSLIGVVFLLLMATGLLVACGDNGSATTTTGSSSSTSSSSSSTGNQRPNRANFAGTISQYDASANTLTIKTADGTTTTFSTSKARIIKSQKITTQDLTSLLGTTGIRVAVTGQQASDGTYTAQDVTVSDVTATGTAGAPQGTPPAGMNGTPPAGGPQGTPPAGAPKGTPRANGRHRFMLQNAKFQNNQLTGTDQTGKSITVNLSSSTVIYKETTGTASDLQVGQTVIVNPARAQGGNASSSTQDARQIIVGDTAQDNGNGGAPQPGN